MSGVGCESTTVLTKQTRDEQEKHCKIAKTGETLGLAPPSCSDVYGNKLFCLNSESGTSKA